MSSPHTIDPDKVLQWIIAHYEALGDADGAQRIVRAYEYAKQCHEGIMRKSGEPYITHPISAAQEMMKIEPDITTVIATILHDVVSHGTGKYEEIEQYFGQDIRDIVEQITILGKVKYHGQESSISRMQKMILAVTKDIRVLFVKLVERIHNLGTIQYHSPERAREIAEESLFIYAPIAARIGLYTLRDTIESLSFRHLDLDAYLRVTGELAHYTLEQEAFLVSSIEQLKKILGEEIPYDINYRVKKPYSIYRKMKDRSLTSIFGMYDIFAIRILVNSVSECYHILGLIHGAFSPMPGRFKDFIAVPKLNGYQSLHTTVLWLAKDVKHPVEIQIRTHSMNEIAEHGIAAHVLYKQFQEDAHKKIELQNMLGALTDGLMESSPDITAPKHSTIFIITPRGDVRELPIGATPVDFAYSIHSNIWYHTVWAKVNDKIVTLDEELHNGDIVEIITQSHAKPAAQWLDFVVSSKARSEIGIELKKISWDRDRIIERGKQEIFRTCTERHIIMDADCRGLKKYVDYELDQKKLEELLYQIGQGIKKASSFFPQKKPKKATKIPKNTSEKSVLIIWWESDVPHEIARCCLPHFPKPVIAVMRNGGRCMIHDVECGNLVRTNPARLIPAYWSTNYKGVIESFLIALEDRPGILAELTHTIYKSGINIVEIQTLWHSSSITTIRLLIEIPHDMGDFRSRIIEKIRLEIQGIQHIE